MGLYLRRLHQCTGKCSCNEFEGNKSKSDPKVNKTAAHKFTSQTRASNDRGEGDQIVFVHLLHTFIMKI